MPEVQRVGVADLEVVRALRLGALLDAPDAFGSTYEREAAFSPDVWAARLAEASNAHFVAWDGMPVGMVSIVRDDRDRDRAWLVGMWVAPDARGSGVADELVGAALEWAKTARMSAVRLHVTEGNDRAERLYLRHGFSRTGASFCRDRDGVTELEMCHDVALRSR